jgi:hypothetical protein
VEFSERSFEHPGSTGIICRSYKENIKTLGSKISKGNSERQ